MEKDISFIPKNYSKNLVAVSVFGIIFVLVILGIFIHQKLPQGSIARTFISLNNAVKDVLTKEEDDSDKDGLINKQEILIGTDPYNSDTDGDGYSDKEEIDNKYDPLSKGRLRNFSLEK